MESSNDAIVTKSLDGSLRAGIKEQSNFMVIQLKKFLGKPISILEPSYSDGETKELIEMVKQGERINNYETLRLRKDGR